LKFAVKRTWPQTAEHWELHGEADSAKSFGQTFASAQDLDVGIEIAVTEDEGDDRAIRFYRVSATDPITLEPGPPRSVDQAPEQASNTPAAPDGSEPSSMASDSGGMPNLSPFRSMFFTMAKISSLMFIALGGGWIVIQLSRWLGG
jgi:hypothetical protein